MKTRKVDSCESAEREAQAQLEIIRALRKLPTQAWRYRVLEAVAFILEADNRAPGVFTALVAGLTGGKKP